MSKGLFLTGTGTDVGKTYVAALLVKKLRDSGINAGYYKGALSGAQWEHGKLVPGDCKYVADVAGIEEAPEKLVSYIYKTAVSPHLAAKIEGPELEMEKIQEDFQRMASRSDYILMEGSGGIICPLRTGEKEVMLLDVIRFLGLDVVLVADSGLGTLNNTALTCAYAKQKGIHIGGILMNHYDENSILHRDNRKMIEKLTGIPVISCIETQSRDCHLSSDELCGYFGEIKKKETGK